MPQTRRQFLQAASGALAQRPSRPPNFIVLFADDMGYSDLSCYGNPVIRTPNLDRMAEEGMRFTSFYAAASVCTPSRVGLLTGRYAVRAGQPGNTGPDTVGGLRLSEILLPEVIRKRGYRTMAIGKWHLGFQPQQHLPTSRGFDSYFGLPYSNDMIAPWVKTERPLHLYRNADLLEPVTEQSALTERYTNEAVKFIRESNNDPFFLYLPYSMPHLPVSAPERFRNRSRGGLYGDVIETLDWSVGEILAAVKGQGIDSDTMVVFASDNGPWHRLPQRMLQKGVEPWHTGTKSLLRGSKGTSYEGGFRVPGIMRFPGVIAPRQTTAEMASTLDLFPTFVKAAGAEMPSDRVYDGFDLMPFLKGDAKVSPRPAFYYCRGKVLEAVREGSWKYRHTNMDGFEGEQPRAPEPQLFHLDQDPAEQYNLFDRERGVASRLAEKMKSFAREIDAAVV